MVGVMFVGRAGLGWRERERRGRRNRRISSLALYLKEANISAGQVRQ